MLAQLRQTPVGRTVEDFSSWLVSFVSLEWVSPSLRAGIAYGVRTWIAGMLAFYIAFFCQLESPYWAPVAVWICSLPTPGMTVSKSMYRIVGSILGSFMAVVLIALFPQQPTLFTLALAFWVATCTLVSNLLRNFRAYAFVLAGYTTAIIALPTIPNPNHIFDAAMARGSCTIIGIICAMTVMRLLTPHKARGQVMLKLKTVIGDTAHRAAFPLVQRATEQSYAFAYKLLGELISLDTEIEYAAAESPSFRIHADQARSQVAELFNTISAARAIRSLEDECGLLVLPAELDRLRHEAAQILADIPAAVTKNELPQTILIIRDLRRRLEEQSPEESGMAQDEIVRERLFIDYLGFIFKHMENALQDSISLDGPYVSEPRQYLNFHRDHRLAWINALRAFVAVAAAGFLWIVTAWDSGAGAVIFVAVVCSLFSALPHPNQAGMKFFWGTLVGTFMSFPFVYVVLQRVDGQFVMFALALALLMIPGSIAAANPKTNLLGFAFNVNFLAAVAPTNPMSYNVVAFLNNIIALNVGVFLGCLAYTLILPADPMAAHRYVRYRIRRGFEILAVREPIPDPCAWKTRMFDRINRLYDSAAALGEARIVWMENGLRALHFGNGILALRQLLEAGRIKGQQAVLIRSILDSIGWFRECPGISHPFILTGIDVLKHSPVPLQAEERRDFMRTLGTLMEMDKFLERHPQYKETT
jgi:uncharacterized membrane protein YccC